MFWHNIGIIPTSYNLTHFASKQTSKIRHNKHTSLHQTYIMIFTLLFSLTYAYLTILTPQDTILRTPYSCHIHHPPHKASTTPSYSNHHQYTHNTHNTTQNTPLELNNPQIPPIHFITYIGNIQYITHTHLNHPKTKTTYYYIWNNAILILLSGDIETHPGPLTQLSNNPPTDYTQNHKHYFTCNTLILNTYYYSYFKNTYELYTNQHTPQSQKPNLTHPKHPYNTTHTSKQASKIHQNNHTPLYQTYISTFTLQLPITYAYLTILTSQGITLKTSYRYHIHHPPHKASTTLQYSNHNHSTHNTHNYTQNTLLKQNTPQIPPIIFTTYISSTQYITYIHLNPPKSKITYYIWNNAILILQRGDIEIHPGLLTQLLKEPLIDYTQKQKQYFPCNILIFNIHYFPYLKNTYDLYTPQSQNPNSIHPKHTNNITHTSKHTNNLHIPPNLSPPPHTKTIITHSCKNPANKHN